MTNNQQEETRRDRWVRLPYILMLMMVLIGALSYFLDNRAKSLTSNQTAQAKTEEYVKRRIAEHDQAAKQSKPTVAVQPNTQIAKKPATVAMTQPFKPAQPMTKLGLFSRIRFGAVLAFAKKINSKWLIAGSAVALFGLFVFGVRRTRAETISLNEIIAEKKAPINDAIIIQPEKESAPCFFSLYSTEETVDEDSIISTYIKPAIASFTDSLRSILGRFTNRAKEESDPMHTLIPAMTRSMATTHQRELNTNGNLFRRAVLIRK